MRGHRRHYKREDYCCRYHRQVDFIGLLAAVILIIYAMPLVGIYMMITGKQNGRRGLGVVLTIVGFGIWIAAGIH